MKCPETERWREELPNSKWRHVNEEILKKIVTAKKFRYPGVQDKRVNGKARLRKQNGGWGEKELECMWERKALNNMGKARIIQIVIIIIIIIIIIITIGKL